jgi:hypothetical protein
MAHLVLFATAGVVVAAWGFGVLRHPRRRAEARVEIPEPPSSLVRVLTSDEELKEAVDRAAYFEQLVADARRSRRRRYEALVPGSTPPDVDTGSSHAVVLPDRGSPRST